MKDAHRIQALAVLLLAFAGWLVFDVGAVRAGVQSFLEQAVSDESSRPAPTRAPTLIGHAKPRPPVATAPAAGWGSGHGILIPVPTEILGDRRGQSSLHESVRNIAEPKAVLATLEEAARVLKLDARQLDEFRRVIEDAARDLDDLRFVPNQDGESWHGVVADFRRHGVRSRGLEMLVLIDFVDTPLDGGAETYTTLRERLIDRYTTRLRAQLDPEQREAFDKHDPAAIIDPVGLPEVVVRGHLDTMLRDEGVNIS